MYEPIQDVPLMDINYWAIGVTQSPWNTWPTIKAIQISDLRGTGALGWNTDIVFSWTSTTSWTAGSIITWDWIVYTIDSGSKSTATLTYIYLDLDVSKTVLQTTTTLTDVVWLRKLVIAKSVAP